MWTRKERKYEVHLTDGSVVFVRGCNIMDYGTHVFIEGRTHKNDSAMFKTPDVRFIAEVES